MGSLPPADGRLDLPWTKVLQIGLYHLVLFLVMISYYALALAIALVLAGNATLQVARIFNSLTSGEGRNVVIHGVLLLLLLALLYRIVPSLWVQLKGLITAEHDENDAEALYGISLSAKRYPEFYDRVAAVARRINAPAPDEIRITPEPECHAVEVRRFAIRPDRRLVLVLGMPHLCVLSQPELNVILAHELSHVRAGDTRLGVFVFRFLESLETGVDLVQDGRWRWANILYPLSLFYRTIMRPLTAPLVRRQETLADAASAAAYGGDLAADTLLKEWQLSQQFDVVVAGYGADGEADGWTGLFRAFRECWQEFSAEGRAYLLRRLEEEEQPSFWDSHPTTGARIALMRGFPDAESTSRAPAHELFPDFGLLEERMSLEFAQSLLLDLHRSQLAEGDQLIDRRLGLSGLADSAGRDDDTISGALDATVHGQSLPLVDFDSSDAPTTLDAATLEAAKRERNSN